MTPAALSATLDRLHWTNRALAAELACDETTIRQMLAGRRRIPPSVAAWLERLVAAHDRLPAPQDWRTKKNADPQKTA